MNLADIRREYSNEGLERSGLADEPHMQFERWFNEACAAELLEPNAFILATVDTHSGRSGMPSQRVVLLKQFDASGYVFFTNYESRKAAQISQNPSVSMLFPWIALERQIMIEGRAERISAAESLRYFITRPLGSQLGAWASKQSSVITSRSILEMKIAELKMKFRDGKVPLPSFWGGYRIRPIRYEFWQGRKNRLHDRFEYSLNDEGHWVISRLSP